MKRNTDGDRGKARNVCRLFRKVRGVRESRVPVPVLFCTVLTQGPFSLAFLELGAPLGSYLHAAALYKCSKIMTGRPQIRCIFSRRLLVLIEVIYGPLTLLTDKTADYIETLLGYNIESEPIAAKGVRRLENNLDLQLKLV